MTLAPFKGDFKQYNTYIVMYYYLFFFHFYSLGAVPIVPKGSI